MKKNYVPFLKLHGLYQKVESAIIYLSAYSDSLLLKLTNNPTESFNSIICKEIGGKRINFGNRGSYNARIAGAVVQYNTQQVLTQVYKSICKNVPPIIETLEERRQAKVARTRESREMNGRQKKFKRESGTDNYYGPQSQKPDLPSYLFEQLRQNHLEKLLENGKNWRQIERDTMEQSESDLWHSLRQEMLTASNFGIVCRMRPTTSCAAIVKNILFPSSIDTVAMKYGREREKIAKEDLTVILKKEIKTCGLFIDIENPCLGASPDGLIDKDGLVEIKCPISAEHLTAEEAIKTLPQLKGIFDKKNSNKINQNHRFFYQIQGQLNITQRDYCIFAVWTPKSMKIIRVNRDNVFWNNKMLPFLTRLYYDCMLPEILDSRHNKHMPIRNPRYIIEAQQEAAKKIINRKSLRQCNSEDENIIQKDECFESEVNVSNILATEATIVNAPSAEQDDDCIVVSYSKNRELTEDDVAKQREFLDNSVAPFYLVKDNVLPLHSKINDESLDRFLRVIRENSCSETQSVLYLEYPHIIVASRSDKSLQIIGGNCSNHWRCIFFDGTKLRVYDSLPGCTYDKLVPKEKNYIHRRYPQINKNNITFEKVQVQPDGTCCGIYAAAFATTIALGRNPCNETYSNDVEYMRQHFLKIVAENKLSPFPK